MRRRLRHPYLIAAVVGLAVIIPIAVLALIPRWQLRPLLVGTPGQSIQNASWSPDGSRLVVQESGRYTVVDATDGSVVFSVDGRSPVWLDDDTVVSLRDVGQTGNQLVRLDLGHGYPTPIGQPLGIAQLVGDRFGHVAAGSVIGQVATVVLDPLDGRQVATLPGVRAKVWSSSGVLVGKTLDVSRQGLGVEPGSLVAWSIGRQPTPIGAGLIDFRDSIGVSPSGDAIVCVCGPADQQTAPPLAITLVPVDGSPARALAPYVRPNSSGDPVAVWLDDLTVAFVDATGLYRVTRDGVVSAFPGFDPARILAPGTSARIARVGDALAVVTLTGTGPTGEAEVTVLDATGAILLDQTVPSWNLPAIIEDTVRPRALFISDPQKLLAPPNRVFVLGQGAVPKPAPLTSPPPSPPAGSPQRITADVTCLSHGVDHCER